MDRCRHTYNKSRGDALYSSDALLDASFFYHLFTCQPDASEYQSTTGQEVNDCFRSADAEYPLLLLLAVCISFTTDGGIVIILILNK